MSEEKTQEERIKDVAKYLKSEQIVYADDPPDPNYMFLARKIIEAADAPTKPKWPTNESVDAHRSVVPALDDHIPYEKTRQRLEAAMLADKIIKAAIKLRNNPRYLNEVREVIDAVNEAGL